MTKPSYEDLIEILKISQEHILQYQQYSEEMRKIGRGFSPSSQFKEHSMRAILENAITNATQEAQHG